MSLSLVTQVWSRALADLDPIPPEKLNVLLQVCVGDAYETTKPKDAGEVLQRALPLALFLAKSQGKHGDQIAPRLAEILAELPSAWHAVQNSPLHTQADFTQLMLHLRGLIRNPDVLQDMQQQLSNAVKQLLEQLFSTATQQQLQQHHLTATSWVKCGCNLLLRALTRSVQFVEDPVLPLLPADALSTLKWLQQTAMGTLMHSERVVATAGSRPHAAAASLDAAAARGASSHTDAAWSTSAPGPAFASTADGSSSTAGAGKVLLRDEKVYLLLTKLVFTATGMPPASLEAQDSYVQAAHAGSQVEVAPAAAHLPHNISAAVSAAVPAATAPAANGASRSVVWSGTLSTSAAGRPQQHQGIQDPGALYELLEWSSSKVKQAMQQLLEPEGSSSMGEDPLPSKEVPAAAAQLAATCIHTLQAQGSMTEEQEVKLKQQVGELLETTLAVGEAAVAAAATAAERDPDSDKVLALGARVIASITPFVAAAAGRSDPEQQLYLTARLQHLMLTAAHLAARSGVLVPSSEDVGSALPAVAGGPMLPQIAEHGPLHADGSQHHHPHHYDWDRQQQQRLPSSSFGAKLTAGMDRLTHQAALRQQHQHRRRYREARVGARGASKLFSPQQRRQRSRDHLEQRSLSSSSSSSSTGYTFGKHSTRAGDSRKLDSADAQCWEEDVSWQVLVSPAEVAVSTADLSHPWTWDVAQSLTTLSEGVKLQDLPLSCGVGSFLLARASTEMLCEALAAAWLKGSAAPLRRLMLVPTAGASEQAVTALALGRLYVKLRADEALGRLVLPLLADLLSSCSEAYEQKPAGTATTGPRPGITLGSETTAAVMPANGVGHNNLAGRGGHAGRGCCSAAEVAGAVVCSLEGMASACVQHSSDKWLYDQALQLLLSMYREPSKLSLQLLSARSTHPATAGLLGDALHLLAVGLEDAPVRARQDLRLKLLLLFSDVAARIGTSSSSSGVMAADLGDLLLGLAVAAEGLQPRTIRLLGGTSSSRMSMPDIQAAQREDASVTRLFRNLWLFTAMHKLVLPDAGVAASSHATYSAGRSGVVPEWQVAAGRLAAMTPLLVVGTDSYHEADMVERLKVELEEQLSQAGSLGSSSSLKAALVSMMGGKAALEGAVLPQPTEGVLMAFILAVALAELSRAALAPLPDLEDDPVVACPISVTLGYLKGVLPDGVAAAWLAVIVKRAARLYMSRLLLLAERQEQEQEQEQEAEGIYDLAAPAYAYAEQLACALIANLGGGLGGPTATDGTSALTVASLADSLLQQLLSAFPALYHSQTCYCALLVQLQQEEGDTPMGQVAPSQPGLVWERTKAWVTTAAEIAPLTTEALLHSFLTSSDSLPGATSIDWLKGPALLRSVSNMMSNSFSSAGGTGGTGSGVKQAKVATQAAFRRAADLLQACAAARQRQQQAPSGDGAYEGALGLTRKLHYTGYVQGLMTGRGSAAVAAAWLEEGSSSRAAGLTARAATAPAGRPFQVFANGVAVNGVPVNGVLGNSRLQTLRAVFERQSIQQVPAPAADEYVLDDANDADSVASEATQIAVAEEIALQLELCLQHSYPLQQQMDGSGLAVAVLSAAALLAVEPESFSYSPLGMRVVKALARAPLKNLYPSIVRLSEFCWCWVTVESPEVLVPLISSLSSAWIWTLDQRMGLFSGSHHQLAAPAAAAAADHDEELPADDEDEGGMEVLHDEKTLQATSAHFMWLSYLLETWAVVSRFRDGRTAAARMLYGRLLAASLQDPGVLSHRPAALGAYFRLLTLGLVYGRSCVAAGAIGNDVLLLFDRILRAALLWFRSPPRYFARWTRQAAAEQVAALEAFMAEVSKVAALGLPLTTDQMNGTAGWPSYDTGTKDGVAAVHPVWGVQDPAVGGYVQLLRFLCSEELARLRVWYHPLTYADASRATVTVAWQEYVAVAWQVDPGLALSLLDHFPAAAPLRDSLSMQVIRYCHDPQVQLLPRAALLLATAGCSGSSSIISSGGSSGSPLSGLAVWAPGSAAQGLQLLAGTAGRNPAVRSYAIKCLFNERPEKLVFFLPQLVQLLRGDTDGAITSFFITAASGSDLFAHQLIWALNSEAKPPEEAFNPEVKRSGWQPPKDTGLWDIAAEVKQAIEQNMSPPQQEYWQQQGGYFDKVTSLSGYLYKFAKDERRVKLQEALTTFSPGRQDLYIPTNPEARVVGHIPGSGACMQSAAKVPILVAFEVELPPPSHPAQRVSTAATVGTSSAAGSASSSSGGPMVRSKMACIFKVGDDIRQDVLAIQVIKLLHTAFEAAGLGLYLRPYGCLPTGYECGIIEVVPNTKSRAALGELSDRGLHDIFTAEFGAAGSPAFEKARENFIVSEAAYAVASYLLQAKDRHNGNIMLDDQGHIVHIDFGFILEISPGGNLGFESAAFKLSHEMTQVLDPGGRRSSPQLALFEELVVRAYLAARTVAEPIIATVSLMADSGLPCFSRGAPVANLRQRFHLEMNDAQAAAFMRSQIADAYDKWTTGFYDYIQALQNKIPY